MSVDAETPFAQRMRELLDELEATDSVAERRRIEQVMAAVWRERFPPIEDALTVREAYEPDPKMAAAGKDE